MPIEFKDAYREALASSPDDLTITDTITIDHPTFSAPFRFAQADKDLVLDGDTYIGRQFTVALPNMSANTSSGLEISLSDIDLSVGAALDIAVETNEPMSVLYQSFLSSEVTAQAEFTAPLEATRIALNDRTLALTATYPDVINKKLPAVSYSTNLFPGLR